jgi:hypothetical protein
MHGAPIPDDVVTGIVDNVLLPLLTTAAPSRPPQRAGLR